MTASQGAVNSRCFRRTPSPGRGTPLRRRPPRGGGAGRTPPSGEAPAGEEADSLSEESLTTLETGGAAGERAQAPESGGNQTPPGFSEDTGQGGDSDGFPGGSQVGADVSGGQETGQLLLLAGSTLVLAIGLLIAALYRKRA